MKFVAYSCTHHPLQDEEAFGFLEQQIEDIKPDYLIHLGDVFEAQAASRWPKTYSWDLKYEFNVANEYLKRIREHALRFNTGVKCVWTPGNHDDNLQRLDRIPGDLRGLCNPYDHCSELGEGHWSVPTQYIHDPRHGCFRLGQVTFAHGFEHGVNSDSHQAIKFGVPYGLFVSGHTHRPVPVRRSQKTAAIPLPYWYTNPGCLRHLAPEYIGQLDNSQWGQAVTVGECETWRYSKEFMPTKPLWDAETRLFRMAVGYAPEQEDWRKVPTAEAVLA